MTAIRILLVDDHQGFLDGLREYLRDFADLEVVGEALSGGEGLAEAHRLQPDVVLLDWNMPDLNGLQTLALLRKFAIAPRVVMLTLLQDLSCYRDAAIAHGADGFLCKSDLDKRLVPMLRDLFALPDVTVGTNTCRNRSLPSPGTPGEGLGVRAAQPATECTALTPRPSPGVPGEG